MPINILAIAKKVYGGWTRKSEDMIDPSNVSSAVVTLGDYGLSVCFHLTSGQQVYHPLSTESKLNEGDIVDVTKVKIVTLSKPGESDIFRVEEI